MPFIIAGFVYIVLAVVVLAVVAVLALAQRRRPGWAVLAGTAGSLAGFLCGCVAMMLMFIVAPGIGGRVGATVLIVPAGLFGATLGTIGGVAVAKRLAGPPDPGPKCLDIREPH